MEKFFVYYRREPTFRLNPNLSNLITRTLDFSTTGVEIDPAEYTFVSTQFANTVDEVFRRMQGDEWSPMGEARGLIEALGLQHTSMSTGDLIVTEDGMIYECDNVGWEIYR